MMNSTIVSRLDVTQIFCEVDDFYQSFERHWQQQPLLTASCGERLCRSRLSLSEVMTIVIAFHGSGLSYIQGILHATSLARLA
ncbi:hypothetical protein DSM107010_68450 [Chroococcidiopsis cubana SAG 39.79]|uniref:IS982 family transposase n=1 Tax=Chroococcidiopsis cubana SAG 39.79 TaxID=388085 RepID=A0AB37U949_9CYAN|nr:hypothetical protein DSM107010_68450 [Chroococcidiopsis cubana SAG 39.79]